MCHTVILKVYVHKSIQKSNYIILYFFKTTYYYVDLFSALRSKLRIFTIIISMNVLNERFDSLAVILNVFDSKFSERRSPKQIADY